MTGSEERCKWPWAKEVRGTPVGWMSRCLTKKAELKEGLEGKKGGLPQAWGQEHSRRREQQTAQAKTWPWITLT